MVLTGIPRFGFGTHGLLDRLCWQFLYAKAIVVSETASQRDPGIGLGADPHIIHIEEAGAVARHGIPGKHAGVY